MNAVFTDKAKIFFSRPSVTLIVLGIAFIGRIIQLAFFYSIRFDGSYQAIATSNLLQGHGISIGEVFSNDLSATVYQPLINWPPGYSLLLAPLYALFGGNYIAAGITLDILAAITFIIFARKILKLYDGPVYMINLLTLVAGFFIYYFYLVASSDAITITLYLAALYYTLATVKHAATSWGRIFLILVLLFACAVTKYLFIPVVLVIPLFLITTGYQDKNELLKKQAVVLLLALILLVGGMLAWQQYTSGSAAHISQPGRGFFPEHLLDAYPVIPAAFLQPDSVGILTGQPAETGTLIYRIFQWIHLFSGMAGLWYITRLWLRNRGQMLSITTGYLVLTAGILLTITALLALLSLIVPREEILPGWLWTYVEEPRYYGLAVVMIQLGLFIYAGIQQRWSRGKRNLLYLLFLLLFAEVTRGMIFTANRIAKFNKEEYHWQYEYRFQKYAEDILQRDTSNITKRAVTGSSHYMNNRVSLYSNIPVLNANEIINDISSLQTSAPMLLLVIIHEKDFPTFRSFLENREAAGHFEGYSFFTVYVKPR